jgi:prepilin-type N-terminal cleavage/methylation domain-containing protein
MKRNPRDQSGMTLIELLVSIIIMGVLSTMVLITWFALQGSFTYSVASNMQRENAGQTLSRMQREIRDAESFGGNGQPALIKARPYFISFYTTFNKNGNTSSSTQPHLVAYRLYGDGSLWRYQDVGNGAGGPPDGLISGVAGVNPTGAEVASNNPADYSAGEKTAGEGASKVLDAIVNYTRPSGALPMFTFMYYDAAGDPQVGTSVTGVDNRTNTRAVTTRLLEDLNPGHSPVYADLQITSQLRNQRGGDYNE